MTEYELTRVLLVLWTGLFLVALIYISASHV